MMIFLTRISFLIVVLSACTNSSKKYTNKEKYIIDKGEIVDIYYSTNSCCYTCVANKNDLKHIEIVQQKTIDKEEDCAGCDVLSAFVFKATKIGIDTILMRTPTASQDCFDTSQFISEQKYIIEVK